MSDSNNSAGQIFDRSHEYRTKLSQFEGPLDILLHFVRVDDLDIYNIPISNITRDFLDYINFMQDLDIELAGEFLVMASELMKIKARMMIPQIDEEGNVIEEDPRLTLVRKLLEYKRFKDVSEMMSELEDDQKKKSFRKNFDNDCREYESNTEIDHSLKNVTIFNLIKAYKRVVSSIRKEFVHPIELLDITPENQKEFIMNEIDTKGEILFDDLIKASDVKLQIICLFLAILQLALDGVLVIRIIDNDMSRFTLSKRIYTENA
ncbi:MAG: segregation/condensation protein A [Bacteroidetes bacterium]|nr:segregation/condensation protein A [Bacteroidota bacterium]